MHSDCDYDEGEDDLIVHTESTINKKKNNFSVARRVTPTFTQRRGPSKSIERVQTPSIR
jgi:hypothetical protein